MQGRAGRQPEATGVSQIASRNQPRGNVRPARDTEKMIIGYARVSTADQSLDRQEDELRAAGCERVFAEAASGKRGAERPQWQACRDQLRAGDTLVVVELSRLGRHTGELSRLLDDLDERGVSLRILTLGVDSGTPAGRLIFTVVGAVAEMERALLVERTHSGLAAARARGRVGGRRRSITEAQMRRAQRLRDEGKLTMTEIGRVVGCSPASLYRYIGTAVSDRCA